MAELYSAAYHGKYDGVKHILDQEGTDINWRHPEGGATALYVACEFGHTKVAELLIAAGADVDAQRADGATPLYKACQDGGRPAIAKMLLKAGAQVNREHDRGMTPLWLAVHQGSTELVRILLDAGADAAHRVQGWSALDLARREKHAEIVKLLEARLPESERNKPSPAEQAAASQSHDHSHGHSANDAKKRSPPDPFIQLLAAAHHGDTGILRKVLVVEGVDINATRTDTPMTALHIASSQGHVTAVKMLLEANAEINKGHSHGQTPLAAACSRGHEDVVRLLLASQADVEIASRDGTTALTAGCYGGNKEIVRLLLDHGADPTQLTVAENGRGTGASPLITAAYMGRLGCVKLLLEEEGLPLDLQFEGRTALEWARARGHASCAKVIERALNGGGEATKEANASNSTTTTEMSSSIVPGSACSFKPSLPAANAQSHGGHGEVTGGSSGHAVQGMGPLTSEKCTNGHFNSTVGGADRVPSAGSPPSKPGRVLKEEEEEEDGGKIRARPAPRDFTVDEEKLHRVARDEWFRYLYFAIGAPPSPKPREATLGDCMTNSSGPHFPSRSIALLGAQVLRSSVLLACFSFTLEPQSMTTLSEGISYLFLGTQVDPMQLIHACCETRTSSRSLPERLYVLSHPAHVIASASARPYRGVQSEAE